MRRVLVSCLLATTLVHCEPQAPAQTTDAFPKSWEDTLNGGYRPINEAAGSASPSPLPLVAPSTANPGAVADVPPATTRTPVPDGRLGSVLLKDGARVTGNITQAPGKYVLVVDKDGTVYTFTWSFVAEVILGRQNSSP